MVLTWKINISLNCNIFFTGTKETYCLADLLHENENVEEEEESRKICYSSHGKKHSFFSSYKEWNEEGGKKTFVAFRNEIKRNINECEWKMDGKEQKYQFCFLLRFLYHHHHHYLARRKISLLVTFPSFPI